MSTETRAPAVYSSLDSLMARLEHMAGLRSEEAGLSELDHGLQCALELKAMAPDDEALQVAGLLHDVAHGVTHIRDHGVGGADAVRGLMGERVAELIELHIPAKRYLVTTDPAYRARLSPVSIKTLALQGGDMTRDEVAAFEARTHWRDALQLRVADEAAKVVGRDAGGLDDWRAAIARVAASAR